MKAIVIVLALIVAVVVLNTIALATVGPIHTMYIPAEYAGDFTLFAVMFGLIGLWVVYYAFSRRGEAWMLWALVVVALVAALALFGAMRSYNTEVKWLPGIDPSTVEI